MLGESLLPFHLEMANNLLQRQTSKNTIHHDEHVPTLTARPSLKAGLSKLN